MVWNNSFNGGLLKYKNIVLTQHTYLAIKREICSTKFGTVPDRGVTGFLNSLNKPSML